MSLSNNDVVCIYLSRNRECVPIIMNESNMRENQLSAIDLEYVDAWRQCVEYFQRESVDGKIELVLEK